MFPVAGGAHKRGEGHESCPIGGGPGFERRHLGGRQERHADQRRIPLHRPRNHPGAEKNPGEGVVVVGRNRIELVVVAAGAGQGEAEERSADDVDLIVDAVGDHPLLVNIPRHEVGDREEPGRHESVGIDPGRIIWLEEIAGDLLAEEVGVGKIAVEGVDHPVAVAPGLAKIALGGQLNEIAGIGIADDVEPVPPPALAIPRRGQQPLDHGLKGLGRLIGEKGCHLLGGRREADQIKRRPAEERAFVGRLARAQARCLEAGEDEAVDRTMWPSLAGHPRRLFVAHRLESPVGLVDIGDPPRRGPPADGADGSLPFRPRSALMDPCGEAGDLRRRELPIRGHLHPIIGIPHRCQKQALLWPAWHDRRPAVTPGQQPGRRRQRQAPLR